MGSNKQALTPTEQAIIDEAWEKRNPSIFLNYFLQNQDGGFYVYPGSVRHAQYMKYWLADGKPPSFVAESAEIRFEVTPKYGNFAEHAKGAPEGTVTNVAFFEKRGHILLPWQLAVWRAQQDRKTVIGTPGVGKTLGVALCVLFEIATIPYYRFLNVAPTVYQSNIMVREIRQRLIGTLYEQKFLKPGKKGYKEKPYATYSSVLESTAEFMNIAKNADNIQGWRGDKINFDEAGLANGSNEVGGNELADMLPGLVSRMTGERPDGKPRSGVLTIISMAYDNDALWQLYDYGVAPETSGQYYSLKVTKPDNPYITPKQWAAIVSDVERTVPPSMQDSWLLGKRPTKRGSEFPAPLIEGLFSEEQMKLGRANIDVFIDEGKHGITTYEEPYYKEHTYVMAGDPGLGEPPFRNAPCIMVWDVKGFPTEDRAKLVGFWWGYANGSITPFLHQFNKWADKYHVPNMFRGYDATGPQKSMAELAWTAGEDAVIPLGFEAGKKYEYLNAAKILMSKGLLQAPKGITGFEAQLRNYRLPDKKLAQDTVSTLCMAAFLMFPLYRDAYPEEIDETKFDEESRRFTQTMGRYFRPSGNRNGGHRR